MSMTLTATDMFQINATVVDFFDGSILEGASLYYYDDNEMDYEWSEYKADEDDGFYDLDWHFPLSNLFVTAHLSYYQTSGIIYPVAPCVNQSVGKSLNLDLEIQLLILHSLLVTVIMMKPFPWITIDVLDCRDNTMMVPGVSKFPIQRSKWIESNFVQQF